MKKESRCKEIGRMLNGVMVRQESEVFEYKYTAIPKVIRQFIDENTKELFVENLGCWFINYRNIVDVTGPKDKILLLVEMKISDYKKVTNHYPCVYLGDGLVTEFNENEDLKGYMFFPTVEYADEEACYIESLEDDELVNVIVGVTEKETEPTVSVKEQNLLQKTYLMKDGNGFTKIGKSFNPVYRESTLQSEKPTVELLATLDLDIELELHKKYAEYRVRGEWFSLTSKQIKEIILENSFQKHIP